MKDQKDKPLLIFTKVSILVEGTVYKTQVNVLRYICKDAAVYLGKIKEEYLY